jgi:hypothetical protein
LFENDRLALFICNKVHLKYCEEWKECLIITTFYQSLETSGATY